MKNLLVIAAAVTSFAFAAQNPPAPAAKTAETKVTAPTSVAPKAKVHKKGIKRTTPAPVAAKAPAATPAPVK